MKKFFLIAGLMVAAVIAVAFGSCANTNTTNQAADNATAEATPVPSSTFTASATPTATPTPTATAAEVKNRVYTNEKFGYKITLPTGYTAETMSTGAPYDNNKLIIKDASGAEFATICTPPLEIGMEEGTVVSEKDIVVPGSETKLHWTQYCPFQGSATNCMVWVDWPTTLEARQADFSKAGMIFFPYSPNNLTPLKTFETMLNSLRFL